jgi:hypothetical protein
LKKKSIERALSTALPAELKAELERGSASTAPGEV